MKQVMIKASEELYKATGHRAYYKNVKILVPGKQELHFLDVLCIYQIHIIVKPSLSLFIYNHFPPPHHRKLFKHLEVTDTQV